MTADEGGATRSPDVVRYMPTAVNVPDEEFYGNIKAACQRNLPWLQQTDQHEKQAVLVGGGPSLNDTVEDIRARKKNGQKIFALNNTARWLEDRGIDPDYHVLLDARESNARFITGNPKTKYLIASQCHPKTFDSATNAVLWHPNVPGVREIIGDKVCALIGGGTTVGLQAMAIAYTMGYRIIHLHGYDSSCRQGAGHAYAQPENDKDEIIRVHFNGRDFDCARWMVNQADEFKGVFWQLIQLDCTITVAGDGLIPEIVRKFITPEKILTAVYDLYCSPPSYDFLSFICAAEKYRQEHGYTAMDVVFQPGPKFGFRNDNLPPDIETRKAMLWRVCVPACRLVQSVRNVSVYQERMPVGGDIFPEGWGTHNPLHCYGTHLVKNGLPRALRSTETARRFVGEKNPKPYVTITVRNCSYWPERNSNLSEWKRAGAEIELMGYRVAWVLETADTADVYAWDIDLRLALYEGALCNLMVVNGPLDLLRLSDAPYLIFKPITESAPATSREFLKANGVDVGDQFGPNGRMVWNDDVADVIIAEFKNFIKQKGCSYDQGNGVDSLREASGRG